MLTIAGQNLSVALNSRPEHFLFEFMQKTYFKIRANEEFANAGTHEGPQP